MKNLLPLTALVCLFSMNVLAATLEERPDIVIEPTPQHFKVMGIKLDIEKNMAYAAIKKHCSTIYIPGPHPFPNPHPTEVDCDGSCPETGPCPVGGKEVKIALDLNNDGDKNLFSLFLASKKDCHCNHPCHCGCVEMLINKGKIDSVALKGCGGSCPMPGPYGPDPVSYRK